MVYLSLVEACQRVLTTYPNSTSGFIQNIFRAPFQLFFKPDRYSRSHGAFGCLYGLLASPFYIVWFFLYAIIILVDRIIVGICNRCCKAHMLYFIDRTSYYRVNSVADCGPELQALASKGLSRTRKKELFRGLDYAIDARRVWKAAGPTFPEDSWHYRTVKSSDLKPFIHRLKNSSLSLSDLEVSVLSQRLGDMGGTRLSFSRFCALLREDVIAKRPKDLRPSRGSRKDRQPSLAEIFLTEDEAEHLMGSHPY